jgi:predicted TIM-barrel fold metal-dependent hydrolase
MRAIRGERALVPCWVVMPHYGGDFPRPSELLRRMARHGVRAVRLFPKQHNFSLKPWCSGDLLDTLAAARIPTFIAIDQSDWHELHEICSAWPGLPLIVTAVAYGASRQLYALWERHRSLSVATSWLAGHGEIEIICRRFGAQRLLFDTRLQATDPGVAITNLTYAEISDEDRALIAHGNIERLLTAARMECA